MSIQSRFWRNTGLISADDLSKQWPRQLETSASGRAALYSFPILLRERRAEPLTVLPVAPTPKKVSVFGYVHTTVIEEVCDRLDRTENAEGRLEQRRPIERQRDPQCLGQIARALAQLLLESWHALADGSLSFLVLAAALSHDRKSSGLRRCILNSFAPMLSS